MAEENKTLELEVLNDGILESFSGSDDTMNSSVRSEDLTEVHIQRGKGKLVQGGARISRGVKGKLTVDIKVKTISRKSFNEIVQQVTKTYKGEHHEELEKHARSNRGRTGWLLGLFGIASGGNYDSYKNQKSFTTEVRDKTLRNAVENIFNEATEECSLKGEFELVGMGTETIATVFAEIMIIESADKKQKIQVVSDRVSAGDSTSGSSQDVKLDSSDELEIVPFLQETTQKDK